VIDLIGPAKVSAAELGPSLVTISVIVRVVDTGSPTRPTIDTSAMSAGKSDRRP
jgi:hypothetical protein